MTKRYALLFGGRSTEHDASVHSVNALLSEIVKSPDHSQRLAGAFFFDRMGNPFWLDRKDLKPGAGDFASIGAPIDWPELIRQVRAQDLFLFNLLHGNEGEDGAIQGMAEILGLKGSFGSVFAASFTMSKWAQGFAIASLYDHQLAIPHTWIVDAAMNYEGLMAILSGITGSGGNGSHTNGSGSNGSHTNCNGSHPNGNGISGNISHANGSNSLDNNRTNEENATNPKIVLKPNSLGASLFTTLLDATDPDTIWNALQHALQFDRKVLIQRYICGEEYTCGCIQQEDTVIALPIIKATTSNAFLGHEEKHSGGKVRVDFLPTDSSLARRIGAISVELFKTIGLSNMARFDYIYEPGTDRLYYLECNSIPGLGHGSAFPSMLNKQGLSRLDLLDLSILNARHSVIPSKLFSYAIAHA